MKIDKMLILVAAGAVFSSHAYDVAYTINTALNRKPISPLIYGGNFMSQSAIGLGLTLDRIGGDRLTCYNWENNASNGGSYMGNPNDNNMVMGLPSTQQSIPAIALTKFQDFCVVNKLATVMTVQMGGYVAADMAGTVTTNAPSSRWKQIVINKGSAYSATPNLTDGVIYLDEMVNTLVTKYGKSTSSTGIPFYQLDNEPNIWNSTHPKMHPVATTCVELISKSVQTAAMLKRMDPNAQVVGPSICCSWNGFSDWATVKGTHSWFLSWYLEQMKKASDSVGLRLLDVVDLHYPSQDYERGLGTIYQTVFNNIGTYYPGTKFGVTEWTWGQGDYIATALSVAFVLGTNAQFGVYLHAWWGDFDNYTSAGFRLFRNYDGKRSTYGDTNVAAASTGAEGADTAHSRIFASVDSANQLHIMLLNKDTLDSLKATIAITSAISYQTGSVYQVNSLTTSIGKLPTPVSVSGNSFSLAVPRSSVSHIILTRGVGIIPQKASLPAGSRGMRAGLIAQSNRIWYSIPVQERAEISVIDARGATHAVAHGVSGSGTLMLNGVGDASGIRLIRIKSGNYEVRQKVIVER